MTFSLRFEERDTAQEAAHRLRGEGAEVAITSGADGFWGVAPCTPEARKTDNRTEVPVLPSICASRVTTDGAAAFHI